jgi:6-phosphogluconolactonase
LQSAQIFSDKIMAINFLTFDSPAAAAAALAHDAAAALQSACSARERASLVVSGGRSPIAFFNALAKQQLPWAQVGITLADERWVAPDSVDSNERLVRAELLQHSATAARFLPLKALGDSPTACLSERWQALASIAQPFDFVVLGMGDDAHTASLFPGATGLADAMDTSLAPALVAMTPLVAPYERISFNLSALLHSKQIALLLQGQAKRAVYEHALANLDTLSAPIGAILRQNSVPVSVYYAV